jgi:hypothetical protein
MDAQQTVKLHYIRAAIVFIACLPIVFVLPVIDSYIHPVLPTWWVNFLFFAPQLFFPYRAFVVSSPHGSDYMFSQPVAVLLAIVEWGLVTLLFSWLAKRVRFRYLIPLAVFTVLFVCVATFSVFIPLLTSLGVDVQFDSL